jgi:hypothetical protein
MTYRIIQWMTGDVGQVGVRHFADSPVFDLVGVLVHSEEKFLSEPPEQVAAETLDARGRKPTLFLRAGCDSPTLRFAI